MTIPKYDELFNPLLEAIHKLGGSATIQEQIEETAKIINLTEEQISELMPNQNRSKFDYRLAWARNYLKNYGLLENTSRGVWSLTPKGKQIQFVDKDEVNKFVYSINKNKKISEDNEIDESGESEELHWKDELLNTLKSMTSDAFERLCQRFLRESGFIQVEVLGKSGDGGIDGHGVIKLGGLLSFHVYFQSKRHKDTIGSNVVRDFRGAMEGRADKGVIITTGTFTFEAKKEAQRDGAKPIDLINGDELAEKLKILRLGIDVHEKITEEITIKKEWFENL